MSVEYKQKSFWDRPEGKVGAGFLAAIGSALAFALWKVMPALVAFAWSTVSLAVAGGVLFALIYLVMDDRFRTLLSYFYKIAMRKITGIFIAIDPIGILKEGILKIEKKMGEINDALTKVVAVFQKIKKKNSDLQKVLEDDLKKLQYVKGKAQLTESEKALQGHLQTQIGLRKKSLERSTDLMRRLEAIIRVLEKTREGALYKVEEKKTQVDELQMDFESHQAARSAMKTAMDIIKGGSADDEIYDQTTDYIADECAMALAELETAMSTSESFLKSIDLEKGVAHNDGMRIYDQWEQQGSSFLLGDERKNLIAQAYGDEELDVDAVDRGTQKTLGVADYGKHFQQ